MDLLGGYGSDDSGSSEGGLDNAGPARPPTATAAAAHSAGETVIARTPSSKIHRKGRKLVSLHAVLPRHILDQLVTSTNTTNTSDPLYDDSDDDDEKLQESVPKTRHVTTQDSGISSLLSDLHAAPTTTPFLTTTTVAATPTGSTHGISRVSPASQPLGAAFMTTQTVRKSRQDEPMVIDIHGEARKAVTGDMSKQASLKTVRAAPIHSGSTSVASVPRPSARPTIVTTPPVASYSSVVEAAGQPYQQQQPTPNAENNSRSKKRSRQEMQKALRSGNFAALNDGGVQIVEGSQPVYQPQQETYQVDTSNTVKMTQVQMYDPSKGTDVAGASVTSKQRSKHQINQLLANAASLELQRARTMGQGPNGSKRAGAKRKYGW